VLGIDESFVHPLDFALEAQRGGRAPAEAIREGALVRFRPITMTTWRPWPVPS
jgi:hypothetical protein